MWENILRQRTDAKLLDARIDRHGVIVAMSKT
jgi:hypothetical protein